MWKFISAILFLFSINISSAQSIKILFDASKAEQAGSADWVIDADLHNLGIGVSGYYTGTSSCSSGSHNSNAQRIPTPAQSGITASTSESFWDGGISAWGVECVKYGLNNGGWTVESLPYTGTISYGNTSNTQDLSNYKIFVLCEPNIRLTASEKTAIMNFVKNGGSLFIVSDHITSDRNGDGWDSPLILNDLMFNNTVQNNPFGIQLDTVNISGTYSVTNVSTDSLVNGPYGLVSQVKWSNGTTITINPTINPSVKIAAHKTGGSGNTNGLVAYARFGKGKVALFGDSSPFDDNSGDPCDALYDGWITDAAGNHKKMIMNTTIWLAAQDAYSASITNAGANKFCAGDSVLLTASAGASYSWSNGKTSQSIYASSAGTFSVTVTNSSSQTASASLALTQFTAPTPVASTSGNFVQTTQTFTSYQWYNNNTLISGATQYNYQPTQSGQYKVLVTDANGCKGYSALVSFTYTGPFIVSILPNSASICAGDSVLLTATSGTNYLWNNGKTTQTVYAKTAGTYSVTVTNSSSVTASASISATLNALPVPVISQNGSTLSTGSFSFYWWYFNNQLMGTSATTTANIAGNYLVKVKDGNGCIGSSSNLLINGIEENEIAKNYKFIQRENELEIWSNSNQIIHLNIVDIYGQELYSQTFLSNTKISLEPYSSQILFIGLGETKSNLLFKKIMKF